MKALASSLPGFPKRRITAAPVEFDEEDTSMLLAGNPLDTFSSEFQEKARRLGIERWFSNIPRNLRVLMDLSDRQLYVYR